MPIYIDPTGEPTYGIAICGRCSRKFPLAQLHPDPNTPGLMVCEQDLDEFDPYRLPARQTENITLPFTRPDEPLTFNADEGLPLTLLVTEQNINTAILTEDGRGLEVEGIL